MTTSTTLQIVDPENTSTVFFDLNDATGANNVLYAASAQTFLLADVDWGSPGWSPNRFQADITPGGTTVFNQAGLAQAQMRVRVLGASHDAQNDAINFLAGLLADGCTMKFSAAGSSLVRYVDIEPSVTPVQYGGRALNLYEAARLFDSPEGIPLILTRQPFFYEDELDPTVNLLTGSLMIGDSNGDGVPNGWTLINGSASIDAANECVLLSHNAAADIFNQDISGSVGTTYTASWEAKIVSGTRIPSLKLVSRSTTNTLLASTNISATAWGTRVSVTGAIQATDTAIRMKLTYTGGAGTTVVALRRAQLEIAGSASKFRAAAVPVSNDPLSTSTQGRYALFYNSGDAPAQVRMRVTGDSGAAITEIHSGMRSAGRIAGGYPIASYINSAHAAQIETGTLGADTTSVSDTSVSLSGTASGGNLAKTTYATVPAMAKRSRVLISTGAAGLVGEHDVWVRVRTSAAASHNLQLRWAPADVTPAFYANDVVNLNTTRATSHQWVDVNLGRIYVPAHLTISGVSLECWSERLTAAGGDLYWDCLALAPADESVAYITVPESSSTSSTSYSQRLTLQAGGSMARVTGDPTFSNATQTDTAKNEWELDVQYDAAATVSSAGLPLAAGHHVMAFQLANSGSPGGGFSGTIVCRVVDVTAASVAVTQSTPLGTTANNYVTLDFDATGGHYYQAQVYAASLASGYARLLWISDTFTPSIVNAEIAESDAKRYTLLKLDSSSQVEFPLLLKGQLPLVAQPGLNVVYFRFGETSVNGYALASSSISRAPTVSFYHSPSYYA